MSYIKFLYINNILKDKIKYLNNKMVFLVIYLSYEGSDIVEKNI